MCLRYCLYASVIPGAVGYNKAFPFCAVPSNHQRILLAGWFIHLFLFCSLESRCEVMNTDACRHKCARKCERTRTCIVSYLTTYVDARRRTWTHADARGRTQTRSDARGRTQTHADARRRTQTNAGKTTSSVGADATPRRVRTQDVCSRTFGMYYISMTTEQNKIQLPYTAR